MLLSHDYNSIEHALEVILANFNQEMRSQLAGQNTPTPGKIMHTKVFKSSLNGHAITQIRCYFAVANKTQIDWEQWVAQVVPQDLIEGRPKFTKIAAA